jgi:hypothetical protein
LDKEKTHPNGLRGILRNFPIHRSSSQRIGMLNFEGFTFRHFVQSWESYLPDQPSPAATSVGTPDQPVGTNGSQVGTPEPPVGTIEPPVGTENPAGTDIPNVFNTSAGAILKRSNFQN